LIVVLWGLFLLGLLALATSIGVSGRMEAARRLCDRLGARYAARAGVEKSKAILDLETNMWDALGERWANSPADFRDIACGEAVYSVYYPFEEADGKPVTNYGLRDEQARVDLNLERSADVLAALFQIAGGVSGERARDLASTIRKAIARSADAQSLWTASDTDWVGGMAPTGPLRSVHELLSIKGMDQVVFDRIRGHVTVYGGQHVNINTADRVVLRSLLLRAGMPVTEETVDTLVRKLLSFRENGGIFERRNGLSETMGRVIALSEGERKALDGLSSVVVVASDHFRGMARGEMRGRETSVQTVEFVWNRKLKRIEYWHED
jgi:type II secretory pathway component PulK